MRFRQLFVALLFPALLCPFAFMAAQTKPLDKAKVVAEATAGHFKATKGKYFDKDCNQSLDYDAEVIDLNGDGQPEVFTSVQSTCLGGMTGVFMNLYIKNKSGQWIAQFGFPGVYTILKTKNLGYPDIEIGGPGNCFPVWRWNGKEYTGYKGCK